MIPMHYEGKKEGLPEIKIPGRKKMKPPFLA
jgi:hypothetical protein